jgi:PAS domain S-box-containing protein
MASSMTFLQRIRRGAPGLADRFLPLQSRDSRVIGLIAFSIVLLIVALAGIILSQTSDFARTEAEKHAERVTNRVAEELAETLNLLDRSMRYAGSELTKAGRPSRLEEIGPALVLPSPLLANLAFLTPDGRHSAAVVNSFATQNVELGDRAYFRVHLDKPSNDTFVDRPIIGRLSGRKRIPVSRAVRHANGELMGVLAAMIDVESLERIWSDGGQEPVTFELVGGDGTVWLRSAGRQAATETATEPAWSRHLPDWRLSVVATLDQRALMLKMAPFQIAVVIAALVACFLIGWLARVLSRRARQFGRLEEINAVMRETVPVEIMVFDPGRRLVVVNRATRAAAGYAEDEIIGQTIEELTHNSATHFRSLDPSRDWDAWAAMRIGWFDRGGVFELNLPNGEWRRAYITTMPDGGRLVVRVDTTEQKKREVLLEASEQRYAELVASLPDVVVTVSPEGVIDYASDAAMEVLGRSPAELVNQSLATLVSTENRPRVADTLARLAREPGLAQTIVCEVLRGDGAPPRLMQIRLKLRNRPKATARERIVDGVIRDVHEQQMLASELASEMERLQSVFQSTGAVIVMLNRAGRVVMANQSALDVLGLPDSKVVGKRYDELEFGGLDRTVAERWRTEAHRQRLQPIEFECSVAGVPSPGGGGEKRIFRFTANPVQDEARHLRYVVLIGVDDTQRRMAEVRLFDASRLSNLGEVASGIGHEINQPLTVIRFASESLREELEGADGAALPRPLADFIRLKLDRIISQTDRAAGIIRDLRAVARKPANDPQPFDLVDATRVGADLLTEQLKLAQIEFDVSLPVTPIMVLGEASRVQQVVINLVLNARDAILGLDGAPPADIAGRSLGRIAIELVADPVGGGAVLTFDDDGPGIPAAVLTRLFEPFFTTKPVDKGTGLGLSISYDIVRHMGGEIVAENRTEGGARFRVILPPLPVTTTIKAPRAR